MFGVLIISAILFLIDFVLYISNVLSFLVLYNQFAIKNGCRSSLFSKKIEISSLLYMSLTSGKMRIGVMKKENTFSISHRFVTKKRENPLPHLSSHHLSLTACVAVHAPLRCSHPFLKANITICYNNPNNTWPPF